MKTKASKTFLAALAALVFFSAATLKSQAPQPASDSLLANLQTIQTANKALIEKQQKTLQTLDEMKAVADQLKTFGKRG